MKIIRPCVLDSVIRLYHGTNQDFDEVCLSLSTKSAFFSSNPRVASDFALYKSVWEGANVRPYLLDKGSFLEIDGDYGFIRDVEQTKKPPACSPEETISEYARRNGFDGIIYRNVRDDACSPSFPPVSDVYEVFSIHLVKPFFLKPENLTHSPTLSL